MRRSKFGIFDGAKTVLVRLDGHGPRYAQLTRALCGLIQSGGLAPGARLPPTRELARDLGCSRNLVLLAYEQLTLEGYLVPRGAGGTFVSPDLPSTAVVDGASHAAAAAPRTLSRQARRTAEVMAAVVSATAQPVRPVDINFVYGLCEPDARMVAALRGALKRTLRARPFAYGKVAGEDSLRQPLAVRLRTTRGIARSADQVLVTSGAQQALEVCARLLVDEGDRVVIEDPSYHGIHGVLVAAGAEILRVPVDRQGLVVSALPESGPPVRLVYVTPSHQFPTGAVMSAARRYALLAWARRHGAHIVEDDYDSEFRYEGRRIEALAALDPDVIYCGTFAKSLFPSLRLGYLSLPRGLVEPAVACKWISDIGSPAILQRVVGELLANGAYDRHIRRMQRQYRLRREALVSALRARLGAEVEIEGEEAGLHLLVWLPRLAAPRVDELVAACRQRGVGVHAQRRALAVYSETRAASHLSRCASLLLGYGLVDVDRIHRGVRILASVYRELVAAGPRPARQAGARARRES